MSKNKKMPKFYKKEEKCCEKDFSYPLHNDEVIEDEAINHLRSEYVFWKKTMDQAIELIDGVTEIVATYKPKSSMQSDWKSEWLTAANKILKLYNCSKDDDDKQDEWQLDEWKNECVTEMSDDDKVFYYHLRDFRMKPMVTVCIMRTDGVYTRGVSICSQKEMTVKSVGREIAYDRALEAFRTNRDDLPVNRDEAYRVLQLVGQDEFFKYKSAYDPTLTKFEEKLFGLNIE